MLYNLTVDALRFIDQPLKFARLIVKDLGVALRGLRHGLGVSHDVTKYKSQP
jgi:hypothetical protein